MYRYPTEEELREIREWKVEDRADAAELLEHVRTMWVWPSYFWVDGDRYHLSTGGWSGNEDLIEALQSNQMFWLVYWFSSQRGGHYAFEVPA